jgi:hypothetical protein
MKLFQNTEEKYISFSKILRYGFDRNNEIDVYRFVLILSSSLNKLSKNLKQEYFKQLSKYFPRKHLGLINRKLEYPYE